MIGNIGYAAMVLHSSIPVSCFVLSVLVLSVALQCSKQTQRLYILPLFLTLSISTFIFSSHFFFAPNLASIWSQGAALYILHILSILFLEGESLLPVPKATDWRSQLRMTYMLFGNPRLIFPGRPGTAATPAQEQYTFVFLRLTKLPVIYFVHTYVVSLLFSETIIDILSSDVSPEKEILLRRLRYVTDREIMLRGYSALIWIWESVAVYESVNAVLSSTCVVTGLDLPSEWPALFGDPVAACGLKNFWTRFWHKLALRPYMNFLKLATSTLGLQTGSFKYKAIVAFFVFTISGLSHALVSYQLGRDDWTLDIQWFLLNFIACFVETVFVSGTRYSAKKLGVSKELIVVENSWLGYLIGYTWVLGFFFWSVPKWMFPRFYTDAIIRENWASDMLTIHVTKE